MFLSDHTMKLLIESGLPTEKLVEILQALRSDEEAATPSVSKGAERQRRYRERHQASPRDDSNARDAEIPSPETKVSPTPPIKTQTPSPPYSPPPSVERKPVADATMCLFEEAWSACTPTMRKRSWSKEKTQGLWRSSARKALGEPQLLGALKRYLRDDPDVGRTGGPGFHLWLRDGKWEQHIPRPEPPAKLADAAVLAHRAQHYRDTGEWNPAWGQAPQERAA